MEKLSTPIWDLNEFEDEVYEPREDTFLLLDALEADLKMIKNLNPLIALEIGSGSGVVITSLSKAMPSLYCLAVDINPNACLATQKTSQINNADVNIIQSDLVSALKLNKAIDFLVFNPPYVPSVENEETSILDKAWAGSSKGRETTDRLFPVLVDLMSEKSVGYFVAIEENDPEEMMDIMRGHGFDSCVVARRKIFGEKLSILRFSRGLIF